VAIFLSKAYEPSIFNPSNERTIKTKYMKPNSENFSSYTWLKMLELKKQLKAKNYNFPKSK